MELQKKWFRCSVSLVVLVWFLFLSIPSASKEKKIPVAGGAYVYNPYSWNVFDSNGIQYVRLATNCYAYAMNWKKHPVSKKRFKSLDGESGVIGSQPGEYGKGIKKTLWDEGFTGSNVIKRVKRDFKNKKIKYTIKKIGKKNVFKKIKNKKTWMVYLVVSKYPKEKTVFESDKKRVVRYYPDYHWYRQDRDGGWSHKPGKKEVVRIDSKGNKIKDPSKAAKATYVKQSYLVKYNGKYYPYYTALAYKNVAFYSVKR